MKIANVDAPEFLVKKVADLRIPDFISDVVRPLESVFYDRFIQNACHQTVSPIWKFDKQGYENIVVLLHTIPIYLRDSRPEIPEEDSIIDPLGSYCSNRKGNSPYIELYLTAINDSAQGNDQHFKWLFTKVLLHELGHAALDIFNWEHNNQPTERICYSSEFGRWREESTANAVALRIIKDYGDEEFYAYAHQYMKSQPEEYALGVLIEGFIEQSFDSVFNAKYLGVNIELQKLWLDYAKSSPDEKGLHDWNGILDSDYVYFFEERYYTSEEELVSDIVNKVLADYESQNRHKMTYSTFTSLFPQIKTGAEMSYEPTANVANDSRYRTIIELQDGSCSLYYWWSNDSLHEFIANVNVSLKEYKNY
ncbi:MAG: hypothetical protein IJ845_08885 [Bacteroidaceae bacterium]|nr:hypothetical protein [Bacteroidaceae bacterium]